MDDIYKNTEEYNPNKKRKILIAFDDVVDDILSNRKLNISLVFITQSYFSVHYILFFSKNSKQTRTSTNSI